MPPTDEKSIRAWVEDAMGSLLERERVERRKLEDRIAALPKEAVTPEERTEANWMRTIVLIVLGLGGSIVGAILADSRASNGAEHCAAACAPHPVKRWQSLARTGCGTPDVPETCECGEAPQPQATQWPSGPLHHFHYPSPGPVQNFSNGNSPATVTCDAETNRCTVTQIKQ